MSQPEANLCAMALLDRLRPPGGWPPGDPAAVDAVRRLLEQAAADAAVAGSTGPVLVDKRRVQRVLGCEARFLADQGAEAPTDPAAVAAMLRGRLLDAALRQVAAGVPFGDDPLRDALDACAAEQGADARAELDALPADERAAVEAAVRQGAEALRRTWGGVGTAATARTQEVVRVPLAGGRVVLAGRIDLVVGLRPPAEAVVEVKAGRRHHGHLDEARFYGLLEALRRGVGPARCATVTVSGDEVHVDACDLDAEALTSTALRCAHAVRSLVRLAGGAEPVRRPGPACRTCPLAPDCPDALDQLDGP